MDVLQGNLSLNLLKNLTYKLINFEVEFGDCLCVKVVVQLDQLRTVNPSSNRMNSSDKYIQLVTNDGHEFWFMGFISYDKALKQLSEALRSSRDHSSVNVPVV